MQSVEYSLRTTDSGTNDYFILITYSPSLFLISKKRCWQYDSIFFFVIHSVKWEGQVLLFIDNLMCDSFHILAQYVICSDDWQQPFSQISRYN